MSAPATATGSAQAFAICAYLGTQGDIWDAQKDMAVAILGAALAVIVFKTARPRALSA